jgi:hypothetical protein
MAAGCDICFQGIKTNSKLVGAQIIALAHYWVKNKGSGSLLKLSLLLPNDIDQIVVYSVNFLLQERQIGQDGVIRGLLPTGGSAPTIHQSEGLENLA